MKSLISISLATLLLLLAARDLLTFTAFKIHQQTIAAELCVNINEPTPMCFGQCFLDQQIEAGKEKPNDLSTTIPTEIAEKVVYFQSLIAYTPSAPTSGVVRNFRYLALRSALLPHQLLQPPR